MSSRVTAEEVAKLLLISSSSLTKAAEGASSSVSLAVSERESERSMAFDVGGVIKYFDRPWSCPLSDEGEVAAAPSLTARPWPWT